MDMHKPAHSAEVDSDAVDFDESGEDFKAPTKPLVITVTHQSSEKTYVRFAHSPVAKNARAK
ncbi:hypothetical protein PPTG_21952 [Phytophthora nicotianae INRA-310]|uniref:Uncharacterized protein n=3 Tax=Phytophthora nicotianae TaxID=4792 RepID=W2QR01_PHYN3|nr:hypothetical protein PPTG_21952 [Phytophthora nicotianae INRA-310]ETL24197.1 hypothetical protein L916_21792 [Phytophthora nicotianae]ETN15538.1 hypothetical protein PPTG_21952 [Phytophthora nicotianae INRA-310]ETO84439.1 hypothetical protein F444_01662 [Phytophthora nicotianae P1976]